MAEKASDAKRRLAEDFGMLFESSGVPRMAGRIFGWLMVCDPPEQSAADLADQLGASKGSISTATRLLRAWGIVERLSVPGRRAVLLRIREDAWSQVLKARLQAISAVRQLAEKALFALARETPAVRRRLTGMRDTYGFLEQEFRRLMQRLGKRGAPHTAARRRHPS